MEASRPYHHGNLRTALVAIARELVREVGPEAWSMREASRRAGVSRAAPYRHFGHKAALLDAVGVEAYRELEQRYRAATGASSDPADSAAAVARAYLKFALDEPRLFRLIFSTPKLHTCPEAVRSYTVFEDAVRCSQEQGVLPDGSAADLAHVLWSGMHGVADLILSGSFGRRHGRQVAERMLEALFVGLRGAR